MQRRGHEFYRKTQSNSIVKLVRERYIRDDIPCQSKACTRNPTCQEMSSMSQPALLSAEATHYVIPDIFVSIRYLEILEQEELTNIIIPQTVMLSLQQHDKTRTYKRLRKIASDPRRSSIVFYNEIFAETLVSRLPGETSVQREERALLNLGEWYHQHTGKRIIVLSEQYSPGTASGVDVYNVEQYLDEFWPHHTTLQNLREVLKEAELEEDLETIKLYCSKDRNKSRPVAGYTEYKSAEELEAGIKSQRYVVGVLKVNQSNRDQASIMTKMKDMSEVIIVGNDNRNRAVHGDMVIVEPFPDSNRASPSFDISYDGTNDDEEEFEVSVAARASGGRPVGRVVGILQRNWRTYVATLQEDAAEQGGKIHLAVPLDNIIPKIRIRHHDVNLIRDQRIVVRIDSWSASSQYPNGHFVKSLGPIHQLDTEISAILVEHGIPESQASRGFAEACLREMPVDSPEEPWQPSAEELSRRRDLRNLDIFRLVQWKLCAVMSQTMVLIHFILLYSIDPPNCQDIDDALSITEVADGRLELGVHIADVSFFVNENSHTDLEARARGTTVYLADRRFDMLPTVLSERVCSLRHHVDRYAVSVIWTLDKNYKVVDTWFGRSVIRSACEMEYEQAQELLNGANTVQGLDNKLAKRLQKSIVKLVDVLRVIRERRLGKGALELESSEVKFQIASEHNITDIIPKKELEIHEIVAEAMIMANGTVAERILKGFKDSSLLRHHPPPTQARFKALEEAAMSKGFVIDYSTNKTLAHSLENIAKQSSDDPVLVSLLKTMATMAMNEAGRYADVIVHRQLLNCVETAPEISILQSSLLNSNAKVVDLCSNLNLKTRESKLAQRDSAELFQSLYVLQQLKKGPLVMNGIISDIRANGFFVYVPRLVLKGPVYLRDKSGASLVPLSLINGKTEDANCTLDSNNQTRIIIQAAELPHPITFQLFDHVQVSLKLHTSHAHRHKVHMTLVGLDHRDSSNVKLSTKALTEQIISGESQDRTSAPEDISKVSKKFKQTKQIDSVYAILESFRQLNLIEEKSE
ncbi:hypothetical protein NQZ79_g3792 [Umbelopsis isabellina]|nr:hypothetical protein NQZ79_g3792 [Umbelopsis isabellina]